MSSWLALVVTDAIAVSTFTRCFTGPGELTAALATLVAVHLAGFAARGGASGIRSGARGRPARRPGEVRRASGGWWALAALAAGLLPVGIVLGSTFSWVVPGDATWHAMSKDLAAAWSAFSLRLAPVPELPGLVLATAWAAGVAGLLSELISSRRKVPAVFALGPASGLYLFAAALGTGRWRALGLGAMAGAACWYLVAVVREREAAQDALVASPETGLTDGPRAVSYGAAVVLRMAVLAALAAAIIGPNLPGARSVALVAWHGNGGGGGSTRGATAPLGDQPQRILVSTLVQVAQEEVDNPSGLLFSVYSSSPTREMIATLDNFNGDRWGASLPGTSQAVPLFSPPVNADEALSPAGVPRRIGPREVGPGVPGGRSRGQQPPDLG